MTDQRSKDALDVAARHANGLATDKELAAARAAAWDVQKEMFIKMCNGKAPWQEKK